MEEASENEDSHDWADTERAVVLLLYEIFGLFVLDVGEFSIIGFLGVTLEDSSWEPLGVLSAEAGAWDSRAFAPDAFSIRVAVALSRVVCFAFVSRLSEFFEGLEVSWCLTILDSHLWDFFLDDCHHVLSDVFGDHVGDEEESEGDGALLEHLGGELGILLDEGNLGNLANTNVDHSHEEGDISKILEDLTKFDFISAHWLV